MIGEEEVARAIEGSRFAQLRPARYGGVASPYEDMARAAISAHLAALEAAGYVVAPRDPTEAMRAAAFEIENERYAAHSPQEDRCAVDCWAAMISAAPAPYIKGE